MLLVGWWLCLAREVPIPLASAPGDNCHLDGVDAGVCVPVRPPLSSFSPHVRCFPSFVIVGAMKAGTGVLMHLLNQHPLLVSGKGEDGSNEIHFFRSARHDAGPPWKGPFGEVTACSGDESWAYLSHFPSFSAGANLAQQHQKKTFDKSPDYMRSKASIARLHAMLPSAKLVVLLRNPATRALSEFKHNCRHGRYLRLPREGSNGSSTAVVVHQADHVGTSSARLRLRYPCSLADFRHYYFSESSTPTTLSKRAEREASHGYYAQQLQWILDEFDTRQVLVLFQEEMQAATLQTCAQVERFVGVHPFRYRHTAGGSTSVPPRELSLLRQTRTDLEAIYRKHNQQLLRILAAHFNRTKLPAEWCAGGG